MKREGWRLLRQSRTRPLLPLVRRLFLAFLLVNLAVVVLQWASAPAVPPERSWPVLPALAALAGCASLLYKRGRPMPFADLVTGVATGVVVRAVGLNGAGGVLFVGVTFRALYGGPSGLLLAVSLITAGLIGGTVGSGGTIGDAHLSEYLPGLLITSVALHVVAVSLRRYETSAAARFHAIVRSSRDVLVITDADTVASYVSPALATVFGVPEGALPDGRLLSWIAEQDREQVRAQLARLVAEPGSTATLQCRVADATGQGRYAEILAQNLLADVHVGGLLFAVRDVSERVQLMEQLRHQALHDPLTGLANRALLTDRLEHALAARGSHVSLLLIDLDGFKAVNDTLGHPTGDALLIEVGELLRNCVRPSDTLARLGGDEFAVLLVGAREDDDLARRLSERVLSALRAPVSVLGSAISVSASIGIAIGPDNEGGKQLMRNADIALYRAKAHGKRRYEIYHADLHAQALDRLQLQLDLQHALARHEFVIHYQPIWDLSTGRMSGVEALLRWNHPVRGMVSPVEFIPLAEQTGLIVPIGHWVLVEACRKGAAWQRIIGRRLQVNVNVSSQQLAQVGLIEEVHRAVHDSGLPARDLTLEITESSLAADPDAVVVQLAALRKLGISVAIDDFGTGYSSLGYLHKYPIDELKIDKSFVDRMASDDPDAITLTSAIVAMSQALRLRTVAEGIETEDQRRQLINIGCDLGQGFHLSRPLDERALEALLLSAFAQTAALS